jgi:hypothetical protein
MENTFNFEQASYSDLYNEAKRLNALVADLEGTATSANNKLMYVEKAFANRDRQYSEAKSIITELIENGEISNEESVKELIDIFGIEILKEIEFRITVEISGTTLIPMGQEPEEYDFSIDCMSYNGQDVSYDCENINLDSWDFTE